MNTRYDITSNVSRPVGDTNAARVSTNRPGGSSDASVANASATGPAQDGVKLLSAEITDIARSAEAFDQAKVDRLRASIADGSYQVDAEKLADRLIDFETLLTGAE